MSDKVHDHTTLGFRRGCVACAQTEADLAVSRRLAQSRALSPATPSQTE